MVSSPNRPVLFEFERRRLLAESRPMGRKDVVLKQGLFPEGSTVLQTALVENLPASNSGHRTRVDMLELSERENLSQYRIDSTWPVGAEMANSSRRADDYSELLRRDEERGKQISQMQEDISNLEKRVQKLEWKKKETKAHSIEWQVTSLTITALDPFFWSEFSEEHTNALRVHGISTYSQLYHAVNDYFDKTEKRTIARAVFNTIDEDLRDVALAFLDRKRELGPIRTSIAHLRVKKKALLSFLAPFFLAEVKIRPVLKDLFEHLKETATSAENIQRARAAHW